MRKYFLLPLLILFLFISCTQKQNSKTSKSDSKVDYNLTDMNYNIVSSLNFEMALEPEKYIGKTFKIRGQFFSLMEPDNPQRFYSCVVYDPTACCQAGMDFVLSGEKNYPEDFPEEKSMIEIAGVFSDFSNYFDDGRSYSAILCDDIKIIK